MSSDPALWGRGWYFEKIAVDPTDADTVYVPNVAVNRTRDGGKTWVVIRGSPGGDDYHQAWISPDDPNTMIVASDQGAIITRNAKTDDPREVTWSSWLNQPTAQIYHLSVDYRFPYWVTGAQQDSGAIAVRSRGKFAQISMHDWEPIAPGGESGYTAGDPLNPGVVFGGRPALESRREHSGRGDDESEITGARARRLDAAAGVLESRSARAVLRESVPVQDDRRREDVGADQSRSHASGSFRPADARCGRRRSGRSQRKARRHLYDCSFALARTACLDRNRRRAHSSSRRTTARAGRT